MSDLPKAPSVGRPARGFTPARAQRWILAAAILTAVTYAFRLIVEPSVSSAPARGGKAAKLAGAGSPPPGVAQWAIAYGAGFLGLSVLALGAPEVAASLAMLMFAGSILGHGTSIVADIAGLESGSPSSSSTSTTPSASAAPTFNLPGFSQLTPNPPAGVTLSAPPANSAAWNDWFNRNFDEEWAGLQRSPGGHGQAPPKSNEGAYAAWRKYWYGK